MPSTLGSSSWPVALLKVGSIRFTAFYFAAFYTAVAATGHAGARWALASVLLCAVNCLGIELTNRYADRTEDEINRPERTALCKRVGYAAIRNVAIGLYAAILAVYVLWFVAWRDARIFAVQMVCWLVGWNYSVGLRMKASRYGVLVVLSATFVLPFLHGWVLHGALRDIPLALACIPVFVASLSGIKDITDVEGDAQRGYRSLFVDLSRRRSGRALLALLASPYALIVVLIAVGAAPPRFLGLLALAPSSLVFAVLVRSARSPEEAASTREWMYHFWFVFLLVTMLLIHPTLDLAGALGAAALFWVVATRRLHWAVGLRADQARDALRMLSRARRAS